MKEVGTIRPCPGGCGNRSSVWKPPLVRLSIVFLLILSIFSNPLAGRVVVSASSIAIDNTGKSASVESGTSLDITSFAIGSGSNRFLVVCLDYYTNPGTTTVTFNGVACTRAQAYSAGSNYAEIWYMASPPSGSYTIHHTQTSATEIIMGAWSVHGC